MVIYRILFNTVQDGADRGILKIKISELEIYKISRNIIPSKKTTYNLYALKYCNTIYHQIHVHCICQSKNFIKTLFLLKLKLFTILYRIECITNLIKQNTLKKFLTNKNWYYTVHVHCM